MLQNVITMLGIASKVLERGFLSESDERQGLAKAHISLCLYREIEGAERTYRLKVEGGT